MPVAPPTEPFLIAAIDAARTVRRDLGLSAEEPVPCVTRTAEEHLGLQVVVADLTRSVSGFYFPSASGRLVFVNGNHQVVRQRFTVAHETAHHVLGHGLAPRVLNVTEAKDGTPVPPPEPNERAANHFAAELLAPEVGVRTFVQRHAPAGADGQPRIDFDLVVRMSCAYGISAQVVLARLTTTGLLPVGELLTDWEERVRAGAHVPRYGELGLVALTDELSEIERLGALPRVPEGVDGKLLALLVGRDVATSDPAILELRRLLGIDA